MATRATASVTPTRRARLRVGCPDSCAITLLPLRDRGRLLQMPDMDAPPGTLSPRVPAVVVLSDRPSGTDGLVTSTTRAGGVARGRWTDYTHLPRCWRSRPRGVSAPRDPQRRRARRRLPVRAFDGQPQRVLDARPER